MKLISKISLVLIYMTFFYQKKVEAQSDSLKLKLDYIFQNLDKSKISTGFLEDYGAQLVPLKNFNGILSDSNVINCKYHPN